MARDDWAQPGEVPTRIGDEDYAVDICPGWLVRQPEVIEAAKAYAAFDKGVLDTYYPDIDHALSEAVLVAAQSFNRHQAYVMRESKKKSHG